MPRSWPGRSARRLSPVEAVDAALAQADRLNGPLTAIVTRCDDLARRKAREAEAAVMRGEELPPLWGVPVTVKDLHLTAGIRTTLGSKLFENFIPDHDQPIVERLKRAGAIIIGKTNTSEFGLIPLAANALFGESNNPWDVRYNTGGSSGGAAAAVACGMGPLATASDGGGSIRIPASFCGVFGVKPQMGRVPHLPFPRGWESLSHQGVLSRTCAIRHWRLTCWPVRIRSTAGACPPRGETFSRPAPAKRVDCGWRGVHGSAAFRSSPRL